MKLAQGNLALLKAQGEIASALANLGCRREEIEQTYLRLARKWRFTPQTVQFEVVGGRVKGKPIREDSDVDVIFRPNPALRLVAAENPLEEMENINAFHDELNKSLWALVGTRLHILEVRGIAPLPLAKAPTAPEID